MFPNPTADPAAARINPTRPEKLPLFVILMSYSEQIERPENSCIQLIIKFPHFSVVGLGIACSKPPLFLKINSVVIPISTKLEGRV